MAQEMTIKSSTTIQYDRAVNICGAPDDNPCQLKRSATEGRNTLKDCWLIREYMFQQELIFL